MKTVCISDTHGLHRQVSLPKNIDLLIFAGDSMTSGYSKKELIDFVKWFDSQNATHKIMIAGNHCRYIENHPEDFEKILENYPDVIYLEDEFITVNGFKVYGTPHSKEFYNWAFNRNEQQLESIFSNIPKDTDILISHAPEYMVLDELVDGRHVGEFTLSKAIRELGNLKLHVFGHIHNSYGMIKPHGQNHYSVNASQVDENYNIVNKPIILEL